MTRDPVVDDITGALQRLARAAEVPPPDPDRERAMLRAFETHRTASTRSTRRGKGGAWWLSTLAATAALLVSMVSPWRTSGRRATPPGDRDAAHGTAAVSGARTLPAAGEFIAWPGAVDLPPLESGELVRMDLPVSLLPSLGVAPPAGHVTAVKADVVIGQDGLARAVRFVGN